MSAADAAQRKLDARVRHRMLSVIHGARANAAGGWVTGRGVLEAMAWAGPDFRDIDDARAMGLLQDLATAGYAGEEDNREDRSQTYGLDYLTYRVSAKGLGFVNRTEPADGLIDDGRIIR